MYVVEKIGLIHIHVHDVHVAGCQINSGQIKPVLLYNFIGYVGGIMIHCSAMIYKQIGL